MDDLLKSLKAQLYDRVASPLLSSFLISWVLWNHRLFVVLTTSDLKLQDKFDYVDNTLYPTWMQIVGRGFAWPLLSALVLLLAYPFPGRWVYAYVRDQQNRLKQVQKQKDDESPMTREEEKELRTTLRKTLDDFDAELWKRDSQIKELKQDLEKERSRYNELNAAWQQERTRTQQRDKLAEVSDLGYFMLRKIAANEGLYQQSLLLSEAGADVIQSKFQLDELERQGLIRRRTTMEGDAFEAMPAGRTVLVAHAAAA